MDHDAIDPTVGTVRASSLFIYLFFFLLFFFCFVLVRQLEHPHSVLIVVMTVFFSDAGCIGLQGFLEGPMWTRASSQDKPPVQHDDRSNYSSSKTPRASSTLILQALEL